MATLTSLQEIKSFLEIDSRKTKEDKNLLFFIRYASTLIETWLNRTDQLLFKERTEYYNGTGTFNLALNCWPTYVTPTPRCWVDQAGFFGQTQDGFQDNTELEYGTDFFLYTQDGVTSQNGLLIRRNAFWQQDPVREWGFLSPYQGDSLGSIKVVYSGGYKEDTIPDDLRIACNMVVAKLHYIFPLGVFLATESYEDRAISIANPQLKNELLSMVKPYLVNFRKVRI